MENYGLTVKKIRQQKGFRMKEIYEGLLGRTTSYRFEQGTTAIATHKLLQILQLLNVEMAEFFFLHSQYTQDVPRTIEQKLSAIISEENFTDTAAQKAALTQFYEYYHRSERPQERFYAGIAHVNLLANFEQRVVLPAEFQAEYDFLAQYLLQTETWTLNELNLFSFVSFCFDEAVTGQLLAQFRKGYPHYQGFNNNWLDDYVNNLLNFALSQLLVDHFHYLRETTREVRQLFTENSGLNLALQHVLRLQLLETFLAALDDNEPLLTQHLTTFKEMTQLALPNTTDLLTFRRVLLQKIGETAPQYKKLVAKILD